MSRRRQGRPIAGSTRTGGSPASYRPKAERLPTTSIDRACGGILAVLPAPAARRAMLDERGKRKMEAGGRQLVIVAALHTHPAALEGRGGGGGLAASPGLVRREQGRPSERRRRDGLFQRPASR
ncbi:hypothetical protein DCS_06229 [Drechmeria coniospora]|uniref:Uncharacterized protein n=1 Tax=Drechmeria coniospora TaxID=98403 RepID=A0A151GAZ4_DRECN|nr:hypothetical protein DCS_06229 [Drechmeria coniospora]KYK54272.1 hypothetical protein DCS_06229 [Drechmeria coniospora]